MSAFAVLSFDSLASFEAALTKATLWGAGPRGTRLVLPVGLTAQIAQLLIDDIVGESPFQSWGASIKLYLYYSADDMNAAVGHVPSPMYPLFKDSNGGFREVRFDDGSGDATHYVHAVCLPCELDLADLEDDDFGN